MGDQPVAPTGNWASGLLLKVSPAQSLGARVPYGFCAQGPCARAVQDCKFLDLLLQLSQSEGGKANLWLDLLEGG